MENNEEKRKKEPLRLLIITEGSEIFDKKSSERALMLEYASLASELHVIALTGRRNLSVERVLPNVWFYPTNSWSKYLYFTDVFYLLRYKLSFKFKLHPNVLFVKNRFWPGTMAMLASILFKIKLVLDVLPVLEKSEFSKLEAGYTGTFWTRRLMLSSAAIRVPTEESRVLLENICPEGASKIAIIPDFFDITKYRLGDMKADLHIMYPDFSLILLVTSFHYSSSDIEKALKVIDMVRRIYPRAGMIILGNPSQENTVKNFIRKFNLEDSAVFDQRAENLVSYAKTANIYIVTSESEAVTPFFIQTALAGCPIVSTSIEAAKVLIKEEESGFICSPDDLSCYLASIEKIIKIPGLRELLKLTVRDMAAELFSEDKEAYLERYRTLWQSAL